MPASLHHNISVAIDDAYCPAARPYLKPVTYSWHPDSRIRSERRHRAISAWNFEVERIRDYIRRDQWPPPLPGDWGPKPGHPSVFPVPIFTPDEWVKDPEAPGSFSQPRYPIEEVVEDSEASGEESDIEEAPKECGQQHVSEHSPWDLQNNQTTRIYLSEREAEDPLFSFATTFFQTHGDIARSHWDRRFSERYTLNASDVERDNSQLSYKTSLLQIQEDEQEDSIQTTSTFPVPPATYKRSDWVDKQVKGYPFLTRGVLLRDSSQLSMDDTATQQATIPPTDSRQRRVDFANLSKEDRSDILCILSPSSLAAVKAVELIAATTPQHILQNRWLADDASNLKESDVHDDDNPAEDLEQTDRMVTDKDEGTSPGKPSMDIALRLSSKLLHPWLGFSFGRAPEKCDMLLCSQAEATKKVSAAHFRIYVNEHGTLMCRDTSTNGTWVDGKVLERSPHAKGFGPQMSLHTGCAIEVMLRDHTESARFFVHMPERGEESEVWGRKLDAYIGFVEQLGRQHHEEFKAKAEGTALEFPPAPMPNFDHALQASENSGPTNRNFVAGTEPLRCGMHWNGGETYKVTQHIGKGAFATVYKLARRHDGRLFAAKEIAKAAFAKKGVMDRKVDQELKIMRRLQHPNIVQYIEHHEAAGYLYIIMELVPHGDLQACLSAGQHRFQEHVCQAVASQMCQALKYLHDNDITHRDLKPDNILISSYDPYLFKLSDFGLSKVVTDDKTFLHTFCGTLLYCAPEVYPGYDRAKRRKRLRAPDGSFVKKEAKQPYTSAVDTWGLAAVLYHLLCGFPPFTGTAHNQGEGMLHTIMTTPVDYRRLHLSGASEYAIDFLRHMLIVEPGQRMSDDECLEHPWITQKKPRHRSTLPDLFADPQKAARAEDDHSTRDTERAPEEELNAFASQLSIRERGRQRGGETGEESASEALGDSQAMGQSKRKRELREEIDEEDASFGEYIDDLADSGMPMHPAQQQPGMLFGEVTHSVLRSSGVLDWQAKAALEVTSQGHPDLEMSQSHYEGASQLSFTDYPKPHQHYPSSQNSQPGFDSGSAAPSLLGAEAMVGQLNMDSEMADASQPNTEPRATSPTSQETHESTPQFEPRAPQSAVSSQGLYSVTPPRSPKPPAPTASVHGPTASATEVKKRDADATESRMSKRNKPSADKDSTRQADPTESKLEKVRAENTAAASDPKPEAAAQGASSSTPQPQANSTPSSSTTTKASDPPPPSATAPRPSTNLPPPPTTSTTTGPTIPPPYGTLTTLPTSVPFPPIHLTARTTSFGRNPSNNSHVWPWRLDTRVPKNAFDITFWRHNIDAQLRRNPRLDWPRFADIAAIISTRASHGVWVNGVRLEKGEGRWLYGFLRTGDVVEVFRPVEVKRGEGSDGKKVRAMRERESERLGFRCEFMIGKSREGRKEGEKPFEVLEEKVVFEKKAEARSREASMRVSRSGDGGSDGTTAGGPNDGKEMAAAAEKIKDKANDNDKAGEKSAVAGAKEGSAAGASAPATTATKANQKAKTKPPPPPPFSPPPPPAPSSTALAEAGSTGTATATTTAATAAAAAANTDGDTAKCMPAPTTATKNRGKTK